MEGPKTQIEVGVDASAVKTGVAEAQKSIEGLGKAVAGAGEKGAAGMDKLSGSSDKASKKAEAATRTLQAMIQRNIAAIEAGEQATARMSVRFAGSLARQRGASLEDLRPYRAQLHDAISNQKQINEQIAKRKQLEIEAAKAASLAAAEAEKRAKQLAAPNLSTSLGATNFGSRTTTGSRVLPL